MSKPRFPNHGAGATAGGLLEVAFVFLVIASLLIGLLSYCTLSLALIPRMLWAAGLVYLVSAVVSRRLAGRFRLRMMIGAAGGTYLSAVVYQWLGTGLLSIASSMFAATVGMIIVVMAFTFMRTLFAYLTGR